MYDRNAFTAGTADEVDALVERTGLVPGQRVLDVGCGTGRHLRELRRRGMDAVGIDVSPDLVRVATERLREDEEADRPRADWEVVVGDARHLAATLRRADLAGRFDVAWSLCHGGFGTDPEGEGDVLAGLATAVRPGGHVVVTAFHTLFAARHLVDGDAFDPQRLVHHQRSEVRGPDGEDRDFDLWTVTHTARDLAHLATQVDLEVVSIDGAEPGTYDRIGIGLDDPELLAVLRRPPTTASGAGPVDDAVSVDAGSSSAPAVPGRSGSAPG
nr:class I SAM-dependent methyltransferase [Salsipaludibacter albus]